MRLPGTPSDEVTEILDNGNGDITTIFVSMATRHPQGTDAEYLQWHSLDHRPEQHRLSAVRASLRLVSTPRLSGGPRCEHTPLRPDRSCDDVLLFRCRRNGGVPRRCPPLSATPGESYRSCRPWSAGFTPCRTRLRRRGSRSVPTYCRGGPSAGCTCCVETHVAPATDLTEVDGVAGVWSVSALDVGPGLASARPGQQLTYCFLDEDPVDTAARLRPALEKRWATTGVEPLFAAPFHPVIPYEWDRYVP